jgi:hypothetical protein
VPQVLHEDLLGIMGGEEMEKRTSTTERMKEIVDLLDTFPNGELVGQEHIMKTLGIKSGSWRNIRRLLETIVYIQDGPKIEQKFFHRGKATTTKYKIRRR